MTATDELRRLLDGRGIEYEPIDSVHSPNRRTLWGKVERGKGILGLDAKYETIEFKKGMRLTISDCSPTQAVEATLGRGTCKLDGYTDAAFRVVQATNEADFIDYAEVCECSACGASVIVPHEYERVSAGSDELWPKFNYCPYCGRKVVDA